MRVTFRNRVRITGHSREFDTVDPSSGLSNVFVFYGGELRRNRTFEIEWSPDSTAITSVEWLEAYSAEEQQEMEETRGCSCVLGSEDSLQSRLRSAYDGIEICLEPGTYTLEGYIIGLDSNITIRGIHRDAGEAIVTSAKYDEIVLVLDETTLHLKSISFGEGIVEILIKGTAEATFESCSLQDLAATVRGIASLTVQDSFLGSVGAFDGATVTLADCIVGTGGVIDLGIWAGGEARVLVVDSVVQDKSTGILVGDEAIVRLVRSVIIDCSDAIRESDSGHVEIED